MPPLLPSRDVPIPGGVSDSFRASLESFRSADAIDRPQPPGTALEWRALQAQRNRQRAAMLFIDSHVNNGGER